MIACIEELDSLLCVLRKHGVKSYSDEQLSLKLDPTYQPPTVAAPNTTQGDRDEDGEDEQHY